MVNVARLGGGITSRVKPGGNPGRTLAHEFVVLDWQTTRLRDARAEFVFPAALADTTSTRKSVAIWISAAGDPTPLQATGGWLEPENG